jgi:hypothetical protein
MNMRLVLALMLAVLPAAGCRSMAPDVYRPGTMSTQQQRAVLHDPFPDNQAGPEVVGGRPLDYFQPAPEPVRSRTFSDMLWGAR